MSNRQSDLETPLYVDLDGTLLATDTLWESMVVLIKNQPLSIFLFIGWLLRGRAFVKRQIAARVELNPNYLPYRQEVLSFLREEKASGKELVLASASDERVARSIGQHLGIFSAVLGSDGATNLSGHEKLRAIERRTNGSGFDYMGNSMADLPLWKIAQRAIVVGASSQTLRKVQKICTPAQIFASSAKPAVGLIKALRLHQWVKNVLLFAPLLMAHRLAEGYLVLQVLLGFVSFSLCASSAYVVNDLFDLEADRRHPTKRHRPFAAGTLQIKTGILLILLLLSGAFAIALGFLPLTFSAALLLYFAVVTAYSFYLKRMLVLDVVVLAGLYTFRVLAGAFASNVWISPWFLAFSMFLFFSLAVLKRYSELRLMLAAKNEFSNGRDYGPADSDLLKSIGPAAGYLSVLVMALYINSQEVVTLYRNPTLLWLIGPCLLYWLTRIWFIAHRGELSDDPVLFALKDRVSYVVGLVVLAVIFAAS